MNFNLFLLLIFGGTLFCFVPFFSVFLSFVDVLCVCSCWTGHDLLFLLMLASSNLKMASCRLELSFLTTFYPQIYIYIYILDYLEYKSIYPYNLNFEGKKKGGNDIFVTF